MLPVRVSVENVFGMAVAIQVIDQWLVVNDTFHKAAALIVKIN